MPRRFDVAVNHSSLVYAGGYGLESQTAFVCRYSGLTCRLDLHRDHPTMDCTGTVGFDRRVDPRRIDAME
jgi:hypothetical protein